MDITDDLMLPVMARVLGWMLEGMGFRKEYAADAPR